MRISTRTSPSDPDHGAPALIRLGSVDSTSLEARRQVEAGTLPLPPVAWTADSQTGGRGRRGRNWNTLPGGRSVALTLVLAPPQIARPARVSLLAAVAVARACEALGSSALTIKWPNDILRNDRKAGGILVETARSPDGRAWLLVGVGLNICLAGNELSEVTSPPAGDLGLSPMAGLREALSGRICTELVQVLMRPDDSRWATEYRRRSWLDGRTLSVELAGARQVVTVDHVTADGDLCLTNGTVLLGEHVSLLPSVEPSAG